MCTNLFKVLTFNNIMNIIHERVLFHYFILYKNLIIETAVRTQQFDNTPVRFDVYYHRIRGDRSSTGRVFTFNHVPESVSVDRRSVIVVHRTYSLPPLPPPQNTPPREIREGMLPPVHRPRLPHDIKLLTQRNSPPPMWSVL